MLMDILKESIKGKSTSAVPKQTQKNQRDKKDKQLEIEDLRKKL